MLLAKLGSQITFFVSTEMRACYWHIDISAVGKSHFSKALTLCIYIYDQVVQLTNDRTDFNFLLAIFFSLLMMILCFIRYECRRTCMLHILHRLNLVLNPKSVFLAFSVSICCVNVLPFSLIFTWAVSIMFIHKHYCFRSHLTRHPIFY